MTDSHPIHRALLGVLLLTIVLTGCAAQGRISAGPFYPPSPDPPRLQFLTSYSDAQSVKGEPSLLVEFLIGRDPMKLIKPSSVAFDGGRMLVTDSQQHAYIVLDLIGKGMALRRGSTEAKPQGMASPLNVRIAADGTRYVVDTRKQKILAFDRSERLLSELGPEEGFRPLDVLVVGDRLLVSNLATHAISVLDRESGEVLDTLGAEVGMQWPGAMAQGPDGSLFVVDSGNFRVVRLSPEGVMLQSYGQLGDSMGSFSRPKGIALDREGRIYVSDAGFQNLQLYDQDGNYLLFIGGEVLEDGTEKSVKPDKQALKARMVGPAGIAIDYDSASFFQQFAAPSFRLEYVVAVADQVGRKVNIYGFGRMDGVAYDAGEGDVVAAVEP